MNTMYVRCIHSYFSIESVLTWRISTSLNKLGGGQMKLYMSNEYDEVRQII